MDPTDYRAHYGQRLEDALETIETSDDAAAIRRERRWLLEAREQLIELRLASTRELTRAQAIACKRVVEL